MATIQSDVPVAAPGPPSGWTGGRIASVVVGAVLALVSIAVMAGGGALLWADKTQRQGGYLTMSTGNLSTGGYALTSVSLETGPASWVSTSTLGRIRIRVTPAGRSGPVFAGIAPVSAARSYLAGVPYATLTNFSGGRSTYVFHGGSAAPADPGTAGIWAEHTSGMGTQTLLWPTRGGTWMVVVMNADASPGVSVSADAGATLPALTAAAIGLMAGGVVLLGIAVVLIAVPVIQAGRPAAGQAAGTPAAS